LRPAENWLQKHQARGAAFRSEGGRLIHAVRVRVFFQGHLCGFSGGDGILVMWSFRR
jgi:hypothetical protein